MGNQTDSRRGHLAADAKFVFGKGKEGSRSLAILRSVINEIVVPISHSVDCPPTSAKYLWRVRAALAGYAKVLDRSMRRWWTNAIELNASTLAGSEHLAQMRLCMIRMAENQLSNGNAFESRQVNGRTPESIIANLFARVGSREAERAGKHVNAAKHAIAVSQIISKMAYLMCRASAALWQEAITKEGKRSVTEKRSPERKEATKRETVLYHKALMRFASAVANLDVDPASLPIGLGAVAEVDALLQIQTFLHEPCGSAPVDASCGGD